MGASPSKDDCGDAADDAWVERAWADGTPFTLLHDDAFVAEKYQEILRDRDPHAVPDDDLHDDLEMTGTDELPMDELERMADAARIKLFAGPRSARSGRDGREGSHGEDDERQQTVHALVAMEGTPLARESREWRAMERRRMQQCEIVREYMTRLVRRTDMQATAAQQRELAAKRNPTDQSADQLGGLSNGGSLVENRGVSGRGLLLPGERLFEIGSFRMQLEMLRAFRVTNASLFENGVLSLAKTVLDFPPFALQDTDESGSKSDEAASVNTVLIDDTHHFARDMLKSADLLASHRDILLILVLAMGVSSGKTGLLLEFVSATISKTTEVVPTTSVDGQAFLDWIHDILGRLKAYRIHYELGTLQEDTLTKQVAIKAIRDGTAVTTRSVDIKHTVSATTDGSYVFTWSLSDGLSKIGTGQNFTVAGRVYTHVPAREYLRRLSVKRHFHCGFYGAGQDATAVVEEYVLGSSQQESTKTVSQALGLEARTTAQSAQRRLYVQYLCGGVKAFGVFEDHQELSLGPRVEDQQDRVQILFALYGEFSILHQEGMDALDRALRSSIGQRDSNGIMVDESLLRTVLMIPGAEELKLCNEKELILVYSSPCSSTLVLEKFAVGESISGYEDLEDVVYHSSVVCLGDQVYLSLMHPTAVDTSGTSERARHQPRSLMQISPSDLSVTETVSISAGEADLLTGLASSHRIARPLFTYMTEGKRLYEVELGADKFRVRVFAESIRDTKLSFLKAFDLNIKQIHCATFVSCFLKILKCKLRVGDLDFSLPSFFTNGSYGCMMLPSITSVLSGRDDASTRMRYDCLMFDCENGDFVSMEPDELPSASDAKMMTVKSFERLLAGANCCFDAANNLLWIVNNARATMVAYRNTGRAVPLKEFRDELSETHLDREERSVRSVVLQVLSFLARHSSNADDERLSPDTPRQSTRRRPFSAEGTVSSCQVLLDIAEAFSAKRTKKIASDVDLECLRCCLCVLQNSVSRTDSAAPSKLHCLEARLSALLSSLIYKNNGDKMPPTDESSLDQRKGDEVIDLGVVSAALSLSASSAHLIDADLDSQMTRVVDMIRKWRQQALVQSDILIAVSLLRQLRKSIEVVVSSSRSTDVDVFGRFESLWLELIGFNVEAIGATTGSDFIQFDDGLVVMGELLRLVNFFVQHTFVRAMRSVEELRLASNVFRLMCQGLGDVCRAALAAFDHNDDVQKHVERVLEKGVLRQLAPMLLECTTTLMKSWPVLAETVFTRETDAINSVQTSSASSRPSLSDMQTGFCTCLLAQVPWTQNLFTALNDLADAMEVEAQAVTVTSVSRTTRTEVVESAHEYEHSLDVTTELKIPRATQIVITFDSRSRTEFSYDYVTFYKDKAQTAFYGEQFYSGRDSEHNWPGVNRNPPLVIDNDHCYVYFHTDASNNDWGFRFTAVGEIFEETTIDQRHWLSSIAEMALSVLDESGRLLIEGTQLVPISEVEARYDGILQSELLRHGVATVSEQNTGAIQLLRDFASPREGSDASRVLSALEKESGLPRLRSKAVRTFGADSLAASKNPISTAIRAATAAILHHNMWGMDAYALAQNLRSDVSEQLLRGWKNAQKMRDWFHLGDAADAARNDSESPSQRSTRQLLRRQPSAYKGMSDDALAVLSKNVVARANFLLEMTPMSFSYVTGAKRRWSFLAKYGSALGERNASRSSSKSSLGKWYSLLDELQEATELRSLLSYRRSSSERRSSRRIKSVTEQVLEFIQSDIDIEELREVIRVRNMRAACRSSGFSLFASAFQTKLPTRTKLALAESSAQSIRVLALDAAQAVMRVVGPSPDAVSALPAPRIHFGALLSGCDSDARKDVNGAFGACLNKFVQELTSDQDTNTEYVVTLIKTICIDYDVDDAYLLHESNVLPQLLHLLASGAARVRRSAQVLLDVFLSRLAGSGDDYGNTQGGEASVFQKQLLATVGFQLEGVTSLLRDMGGGSFAEMGSWTDREHNLAQSSRSLIAPVSKDCDVRWNHSIMLWVFVSSAVTSYALKVGDQVRHGPSWCDSHTVPSTSQTAEEVGVVVNIPTSTTVRVKWTERGEETEHAFDPKSGKLDVVLLGETIGGVVFSKGTKTLVKDSPQTGPWSHFGLFLNERRQLSYKISCGPDKECVYDTNFELDCNEWAHVAIVQNEETLKIYANGLLITQHLLDPFLVLRSSFSASESKMVESVHPTSDPADQYWPIHIPGASKIRVIFDPLSEIDQSSGFVRIYKNARCNEIWGEDKYTGRYHDPERNFPGALSNRHRSRRSLVAAVASQGALEIASDRFLVYFHHEGDSTSWGFRLLATPEFANSPTSGASHVQPSLNSHPFYIGEPPARIMDEPAAKCWVYQPEVVNVPLPEDEIVDEMQASCPSSTPSELPLERALHVIGLLQTCANTSFGREMIATPENVGDLMLLAFDERTPVEARCASVVVLGQLCPLLSAEFLGEQFKRVLPSVAATADFVEFLFSRLSGLVNVWSHYTRDQITRVEEDESDSFESTGAIIPCPLALQNSAVEATSLAAACASLLRQFAMKEEWIGRVCECIESALSTWKDLSEDGSSKSLEGQWACVAGNITAALTLLGGEHAGVGVNARVRCCANIDGKETTETGYLLRFRMHNGQRTARVLFDCDPTQPVDVPIGDVGYLGDETDQELADFLKAVEPLFRAGKLQEAYSSLLGEVRGGPSDHGIAYAPKVSRKENVEVLESEHPYTGGENVTYPLFFHGGQEIEIYFDELSCTAGPDEYVSFRKRNDDHRSSSHPESNNDKSYWGEERYYGRNFPGVAGIPPLRIPARCVDVHFSAEGILAGTQSTEWGFKLTAHAYEETTTYPPEMPPRFSVNAINEIRARTAKSLHSCLRAFDPSPENRQVFASLQALIPCLTALANAPDDGRPMQCAPKTQVFESKHPYDNSVRECMAITFSGAARLVITFDPRSHTEASNDVVCFFKDQSLNDRWGEHEYSGSVDSGNWPGVAGRPPLVIPSETFTLLWTTDASNVEWGWRFSVSAEYPVVSPLAMTLHQLHKQAQDMWDILYEGIGPQRTPFKEEYRGFEPVKDVHTSQINADPTKALLRDSSKGTGNRMALNGQGQRYRVIDEKGVEVFDIPRGAAIAVERFNVGDEFVVIMENDQWLQVASNLGGASGGWVRHRTDDKVHVVSIQTCLANEDVLVLDVDDTEDWLAKTADSFHLDLSNPEQEVLTKFTSHFSCEALKGQSMRYQSLAYDIHRAMTIKHAREVLFLLIRAAMSGFVHLQASDFGTPDDLLTVLSQLFQAGDCSEAKDSLEPGFRQLLLAGDGQQTGDGCIALIDRCVEILEKSSTFLPPGRGGMRILESSHPYLDDLNQYWQLSLPGAKKILVYFDSRSKTEESCDWVTFYKNGTDRSTFYGDSQYHGRNGSENWPGCGGRSPLVIDADSFEVYFHSDANQNDWGFKLFAVGVFDEPERSVDATKTEATIRLMRLCFWVLRVAASTMLASPTLLSTSLAQSVFSSRVIQMLVDSIHDHPQRVRPKSLELVQCLVQNRPFVHSLPSSLVETLRNLLATKVRSQYLVEDRSGRKSEYLQLLIECAVAVDLAVDSSGFLDDKMWGEKDDATVLPLSAVADSSCQWSMEPQPVCEGPQYLQLAFLALSGPAEVSLLIWRDGDQPNPGTIFQWESIGKMTVAPLCGAYSGDMQASLQSEDVISVYIALATRTLVVRKNSICVLASSNVELDEATVEGGRVGLRVKTSSQSDVIGMKRLAQSPLSMLPVSITPNWYNKVCDAVTQFLDFREERAASIVECESEHPLPTDPALVDLSETRVRIPGAKALEIRFDRRTVLDDRHRLRFVAASSKPFEAQVVGVCGTKCDVEYPGLFLVDRLKRTGILRPGDRVVRSSDWCYADEDGGPGTIGIVEEIVSWGGRSGCGVRVRWARRASNDEESAGTYRYGHDGFFDVQLARQAEARDTPLVIPGDSFDYVLDCIQQNSARDAVNHANGDAMFQGTLRLDPKSPLSLDVRKLKLLLGDECTMEWWLCLQDTAFEDMRAAEGDGARSVIALLRIATLDPAHGITVCVAEAGRLCIKSNMNGELVDAPPIEALATSSGATTISPNLWVHMGVVFTASKLSLYANGELVTETVLEQKLLLRSLYIASLEIGSSDVVTANTTMNFVPMRGHVCDFRVWDVALRSEQIQSHSSGIDGATPRDSSSGWQIPMLPQAPRKQSRSMQLSQLLPPPSPPRSPSSPSRGASVPPHQKRWVTVNRSGRDLVTVRADCPITLDTSTFQEAECVLIYYEAHVLSGGRLSVGWIDVGATPSARDALLGEYDGAFGIELPRRRALFNAQGGVDLDEVTGPVEGLRSPRRRTSSSSSGSSFFGDVYSREGDVLGCAYAPAVREFRFYLNGELLTQFSLDGESPSQNAPAASSEGVSDEFDTLIGEMLSMGFSRDASVDALGATSGGGQRTVRRAVDWLLEEGTRQEGGATISSPRRLSSSSPFASPRRRLSSASSGKSRRGGFSVDVSAKMGTFVPAATLGAQGAQGIAWNFGHRPFKHTPLINGTIVSVMEAANQAENDGERIRFDVFEHNDRRWERATHRHRVQDMAPTLLARWKLDEGSGATVYDSSGRDQVGTIRVVISRAGTSADGSPLSPRARKLASCWDSNCVPPIAMTRGGDDVVSTPSPITGGDATPSTAVSTVWGFRFYVIPHFSTESIGRRRFQTQVHRFLANGPTMELRHDQQLIKYVNKTALAKQLSLSQLLRAPWAELAPSDAELIKWPALVEVATGIAPTTSANDPGAVTRTLSGGVKAAALDRLGKRFKLLQELNCAVSRLLPFVAFDEGPSTIEAVRLCDLIREQRYRIFNAVKRGLWDEALSLTAEKGVSFDLVINRPKAMRHRVSGKTDTQGRFSVFSQAFRQMSILGGTHFRRASAVYKVHFLGENSQDAGGPYRETLAQFADELHSNQLPLLIASSNAQHNVGAAREKWVLNPSAMSSIHLQMLEFLGKLMGAAIRSQEYISLQVAQLIWKKLAGEAITTDDLALIDSMIVSSMQKIRSIDQFGVTPDMFEDIVMETFTTLSTDNRVVPLKPGGTSVAVTFDSRVEFADLVEHYRIHEFDVQVEALFRGLAKVVPPRLLSLFTGAELEQMVCGSPEVDVDLLQRCTEYSSCSPEDDHIVWFWQVLREFGQEERSAFLRFVWGRSRLPSNEKEFPQQFKLLSFSKTIQGSDATAADAYLPISHTCFFSVELPRYSSADVVREKLVYAMYNCQEIDGDGDSVAANQLGWED